MLLLLHLIDPFRPSSYNSNVLTWQGRRLTSFGSNSYTYNSEGIRTSKTTLNGTYNYYLEGNKIVKEIKPNNESVIYHYDEEGMLVGFNYNNNEYFYSRDLTGNINKIIDINGIVKVEYKYDAWGNILSIIGDNTVKYANSFLYKGYYYDFETSIYYCNSRYYDPEVLRWISIDEVSYLDSDSATGINLWCYCNNNPIVGYDPDGYWSWKKFLLGVAITAVVTAAVALTIVTAGTASAIVATGIATYSLTAGASIAIAATATTGLALSLGSASDSTVAIDLSANIPESEFGKVGYSFVFDFDENNFEIYRHYGFSISSSPGISYSVGFIDNYKGQNSYSGKFYDVGGEYFVGIDRCWTPRNPNGANATMVTFSSTPGIYAGVDWYDRVYGFSW